MRESIEQLERTARRMVVRGKGILAADESLPTIAKRFQSIGLESTEVTRRDWRELLFGAEEAMRSYISGVILFDETIRQRAADGTPLTALIKRAGALVGIKVDKGAKPLAGAFGKDEMITEGLDGLRERLAEYYGLGARFAKWRAVLRVGASRLAMETNAHALARYAALCQEAGIVPIVEPEVLMDGVHDIDACFETTERQLRLTFRNLFMQRVRAEAIVLKPNMVLSGIDCPRQAGIEEVAERTLACLRRAVPACVPGIAFLSGGQTDELASARLHAINQLDFSSSWVLTFSYGRALQGAPLKIWGGRKENISAARMSFVHRAAMNGLATEGKWSRSLETRAA